MSHTIQHIRSVVFITQMYVMLAVIAVVFLPVALLGGRSGAIWVCRSYAHWVVFTARWMIGLRCEVRGTPPTDDVLVAAKHQSFLDILLIFRAVPRGRFIMKKELVWTPFVGWYGYLIGCIPVDRGKRAKAIKSMLNAANSDRMRGGQLIIFSQGTRVAPGVKAPYKIGTGALYRELKLDCVPVATNVGVFWPRRSMFRKPGLAVVEFLPRIPAGLSVADFMAQVEAEVETASDKLMAEAGFEVATAGPMD